MTLKTLAVLVLGALSTAVQAHSRQHADIQPVYPSPTSGAATQSSNRDAALPGAAASGMDATSPATRVRSRAGQLAKPLAPPAPMKAVMPVSENGFIYMCGGIGSDEAAEMKREAQNYHLMLTFSSRNGSYLANINVEIGDQRGASLLKVNCDAPIMLLRTPKAGSYRVRAETGGYTVTKSAVVQTNIRGKQVRMVWPEPAAKVEANTTP